MTRWLWNTKCELCGYKTPFFRRQWVAKALAAAIATRDDWQRAVMVREAEENGRA